MKLPLALAMVGFAFSLTYPAEMKTAEPGVQKRINIAVVDFEPRGGLSADEILTLSDRFRNELIATGKYNVLERNQMKDILTEQGFQQTGVCSEASCIVEVGQLLAVHEMVGGSISKVGKVFSVNLKIIDVGTGKIGRELSDDFKCSLEDLLSINIRNMARQLAGIDRIRKPWYASWYFWTPVAAAAGGVTAYLLLRDDTPPPADEWRTITIQGQVQ